jgi:hypothetical protein
VLDGLGHTNSGRNVSNSEFFGPFNSGYLDTAWIRIPDVSAQYPILIRIRDAVRCQTEVSVFHSQRLLVYVRFFNVILRA